MHSKYQGRVVKETLRKMDQKILTGIEAYAVPTKYMHDVNIPCKLEPLKIIIWKAQGVPQ